MTSATDLNVEISDTASADGTPVPAERAKTAVVIDRGANRAWSGEGATESEATTRAVRSFVGHRTAREYVGN